MKGLCHLTILLIENPGIPGTLVSAYSTFNHQIWLKHAYFTVIKKLNSLPKTILKNSFIYVHFLSATIEGGLRKAETLFDDVFIRKFIVGTFHNMVHSEVIIKRQHNIIRIAMILLPRLSPSKLGFLLGYSEEILSFWFQCPVKIEFQTISSAKDVVFKYV